MEIRNKQEQIAYNVLVDFYNIAYGYIKPLILDGGTLLGAYRDKGFCEDDWDDIDLTTHYSEWEKQPELTRRLKEKGFEVYHIWDFHDNKTPQVSYKKNGCKVDLMFKRFKNDKGWWTVYGAKTTYKSVKAEYYKEIEDIKFGDLTFKKPKNIDKYLTKRYGDWNEKVHRSNYLYYETDKCIVDGYESI